MQMLQLLPCCGKNPISTDQDILLIVLLLRLPDLVDGHGCAVRTLKAVSCDDVLSFVPWFFQEARQVILTRRLTPAQLLLNRCCAQGKISGLYLCVCASWRVLTGSALILCVLECQPISMQHTCHHYNIIIVV